MRRFISNRWWAFALTLVLAFTGVVAMPAVGRTDGGGSQVGETPQLPGGPDPTSQAGDPDVPINTGKQNWKPSARRWGTNSVSTRGVGDVPAVSVPLVYKYRLSLQFFRLYVLHF